MHSSSCNCPRMLWPWVPCGNVGSTLSPWWREEASNHVIQRMNKVPLLYGRRNCFVFLLHSLERRKMYCGIVAKATWMPRTETRRWDRLRTASAHLRAAWWTDSLFCSYHQRFWLIKWTKQKKWRCWEQDLERISPCLSGTVLFQIPDCSVQNLLTFLATALRASKRTKSHLPSKLALRWGCIS